MRALGILLTVQIAIFLGLPQLNASADKQVYFGDLHVHTSWSFDAYVTRVRTTPEDAYRYARGEEIPHLDTGTSQIREPLDFMAVTDHAEYIGVFPKLDDPDSPVSSHPKAKALTNENTDMAVAALTQLALEAAAKGGGKRMVPDPMLYDKGIMQNAWKKIVATADRYYEPGKFTTFAGFEWSSTPTMTSSLHRNVIFRDTEILPERPFSMIDSNDPEGLWDWMEAQREAGSTLLAIPHNPNMSGGYMFALQDLSGNPISRAYAEHRMQNEPVVEVVQIKGQSMIHSQFAPDEALANFEPFHFTYGSWMASPPDPASYVRPSLGKGLQKQREFGVNPFQYGFIGSSDSHDSNSPGDESRYSRLYRMEDYKPGSFLSNQQKKMLANGSGGIAAVWAEDNTREAIYDALLRKEVYATSGPRIRARIVADWAMKDDWISENGITDEALARTPMGSNLPAVKGAQGPHFLIWAEKDPNDANLDRVQMIKGWLDENGAPQERVIDILWNDGRELDAKGELPDLPSTVDIAEATYANSEGAETIYGTWQDKDFDPEQPAYYFLRILQIPTPRWTTYDAARLKIEPPKEVPATIQERAWTSPIWYTPSAE